ncbi:single-strand DNA-binding protein [Parapedobacter composti]|uniref:Single-stranded DNA-binding protein n=1 Tax=Parapedobacter composti TaxID=623281 RepID=A0A1I1IMM3_9SPHI|nr:single-stranded DNA-binding protein [Parapedobacter composti]SFC35013.1 single-strand DNA-binding protein [Parapedobacter composti]
MNRLKNSVRLTGFLGSNPETKVLDNNRSLARVSIATNERYRNAHGDWVTDTQWHNLVFWGSQAVFAQKSLTKGSEICVEGKLVNRQYVDKDGVTRYVTEINVNEVLQLNRKPEK